MPNLDIAGLIALAIVALCVVAWFPVIKLAAEAVAGVIREARREHPSPQFDADGFRSWIEEVAAENNERAARGLAHADRARAERERYLGAGS